MKVKILKAITEQIIGADEQIYGPFAVGEEVELPPENAQLFADEGAGEIIMPPVILGGMEKEQTEQDEPIVEEIHPLSAEVDIEYADRPVFEDQELILFIHNLLSQRLAHDEINRLLVFLVGFSTYTHTPLNLFLKGPTSSGKTYLVTTVLALLPKADVWFLGDMSPKSLIHEYGTPEQIDNVWYYVIDLNDKVLAFLESPHPVTLNMLKPILSHDKYEIMYKVTVKDEQSGLKTKRVIIRGWPATVFCTTRTETEEELSTRFLIATPDVSKEKVTDALDYIAEEYGEPWKNLMDPEQLEKIRAFISFAKREKFIPAIPGSKKIAETWKLFYANDPRIMRDFKKFLAIVGALACLHSAHRIQVADSADREKKYCFASATDIMLGYIIYDYIKKETERGVPKYVFDFFDNILVPLNNDALPLTIDRIIEKYRTFYKVPISEKNLVKDRLQPLIDIGWVTKDTMPDDRRKNIYVILGDIVNTIRGTSSLQNMLKYFANIEYFPEVEKYYVPKTNGNPANPAYIKKIYCLKTHSENKTLTDTEHAELGELKEQTVNTESNSQETQSENAEFTELMELPVLKTLIEFVLPKIPQQKITQFTKDQLKLDNITERSRVNKILEILREHSPMMKVELVEKLRGFKITDLTEIEHMLDRLLQHGTITSPTQDIYAFVG